MRETVLLLPGLLCDAHLYASQTQALSDIADWRLVDLTRDDSMVGMADRVLAEAPERFALCGLSMGGYLAQFIALRAPTRITRLALFDCQARSDTAEARDRRLRQIGLAEADRFTEVPAEMLPLFVHPRRLDDAPLVADIQAMATAVGPAAFVRQQRALLGRESLVSRLHEITSPTLVICGREDRLTPLALSLEMAAGIADATLVVIPDCGHLSTMEQPLAVNAQLRVWLGAAG